MATTIFPSQRRSLWAGSSPPIFTTSTSPSSVYSYDKEDFLKLEHHRHSVMHKPAAFLEKLQEFEFRPRTNSKGSKDSTLSISRPKMLRKKSSVFSQLGATTAESEKAESEDSSSRSVMGSIRGKLLRKKTSAPLLSILTDRSRQFIESPTTPTGPAVCFSPTSGILFDSHEHIRSGSLTRRKLSAVIDNDSETTGLRQQRRGSDDSAVIDDVEPSVNKYHKVDHLSEKNGMLLIPYPPNEAPYMLPFNDIQLLMYERYTHALLRRLNRHGGPAFHDYGLIPPSKVLDLGCGQGWWVAEAGEAWGPLGTRIIGFDIVDVVDERAKSVPGVAWKRGNFVAHSLPFKDESFDLVRMANLALCVPRERWEHVMSEAWRVLRPKGRLEVIDDKLIFPYLTSVGSSPKSTPPASIQTARSSWNGSEMSTSSGGTGNTSLPSSEDLSSSFLDLELDIESDAQSVDSAPGLCSDDSPSNSSCEELRTPTDENTNLAEWGISSPDSHVPLKFHEDTEPLCRDVEGVFESMLSSHGIDPRPQAFLTGLLEQVCGPDGKVRNTETFHMSLLNPQVHDRVLAERDEKKRRAKKGSKKAKKEQAKKLPVEIPVLPQPDVAYNEKAAKLLGLRSEDNKSFSGVQSIDTTKPTSKPRRPTLMHTLSGSRRPGSSKSFSAAPPPELDFPSSPTVTATIGRPEQAKPFQPAGLFLYPNRFIEMTPQELEIHVSKHIHTLLGCKVALSEFALGLKGSDGESLITEDDWDAMLWTYECSRRKRFNLPYNESEFLVEPYEDDSSYFNGDCGLSIPPQKLFDLRPKKSPFLTDVDFDREHHHIPFGNSVRSIRVYEATKHSASHIPS